MPSRIKSRENSLLSPEDIVRQYFQFVESRDVQGALDLFDYDAVVYEPFSKSAGLVGRSAIEPFLRVAMMANSGLRRTIEIQKQTSGNTVVALVMFEKGDRVRGRFTFAFTEDNQKIRSLRIEFL
jgi:hypothetical protein